MVTRDADIIMKQDNNYYLELTMADKKLEISLTEDKQNEVKSVFNELILALKKGVFCFKLIKEDNNLYHNISKEYLKQLNLELATVYTELENYGLLEDKTDKIV